MPELAGCQSLPARDSNTPTPMWFGRTKRDSDSARRLEAGQSAPATRCHWMAAMAPSGSDGGIDCRGEHRVCKAADGRMGQPTDCRNRFSA